MNFNTDIQHKVRINHGFRTEDVTCLIGIGTCDYCGQTRIEVRNFDINGVDAEPISSTICRECMEDDPELELVGTFPTVPAQEPEAEEEAEGPKDILEAHCSLCGATEEGGDSYSACCNESIESHGIEDFLTGELKPALYYPNGTNAPGVEKTCGNQDYCSHE